MRVQDVEPITARWLSKGGGRPARGGGPSSRETLNFEKALQEPAPRCCLGPLADAVGQAQQQSRARASLAHPAGGAWAALQERALGGEAAAAPPTCRGCSPCWQSSVASTLRVSLPGSSPGGKRVRIQLVEEKARQLEAPPLP